MGLLDFLKKKPEFVPVDSLPEAEQKFLNGVSEAMRGIQKSIVAMTDNRGYALSFYPLSGFVRDANDINPKTGASTVIPRVFSRDQIVVNAWGSDFENALQEAGIKYKYSAELPYPYTSKNLVGEDRVGKPRGGEDDPFGYLPGPQSEYLIIPLEPGMLEKFQALNTKLAAKAEQLAERNTINALSSAVSQFAKSVPADKLHQLLAEAVEKSSAPSDIKARVKTGLSGEAQSR